MSDLIIYSQPEILPSEMYLEERNQSERGRETQQDCLERIANILIGMPDPRLVDWGAIRFPDTLFVKTQLTAAIKPNGESYSPAYINKHLSALRGTIKMAKRAGLMSYEDCQNAIEIEGIKDDNEEVLSGRALSIGEITALTSACEADPSPSGIRDASIICLMYSAGLRRTEVVGIDLDNYVPEEQALKFIGKGNRKHENPVLNGTEHALQDWLEIRGDAPGALYVAINKSGKLSDRRMTPQAIYKMLRKRAKQAKVRAFSPHDLRRSCISDLLEKGNDLSVVSKLVGHKNPATTAKYDRRGTKAKQEAVNSLFVPYVGRA